MKLKYNDDYREWKEKKQDGKEGNKQHRVTKREAQLVEDALTGNL